jgi:hypothetical protein
MRSTAHRAPHQAEHRQKRTYYHQDDADRPQDRNLGRKADYEKDYA